MIVVQILRRPRRGVEPIVEDREFLVRDPFDRPILPHPLAKIGALVHATHGADDHGSAGSFGHEAEVAFPDSVQVLWKLVRFEYLRHLFLEGSVNVR
jgi:hypothetical protein